MLYRKSLHDCSYEIAIKRIKDMETEMYRDILIQVLRDKSPLYLASDYIQEWEIISQSLENNRIITKDMKYILMDIINCICKQMINALGVPMPSELW